MRPLSRFHRLRPAAALLGLLAPGSHAHAQTAPAAPNAGSLLRQLQPETAPLPEALPSLPTVERARSSTPSGGPRFEIKGENPWRWDGEKNNMYQTEHDEMFAAIRKGDPINNGERMTKSTLMAIMGRMSAYTGKSIT